MYIRIFDSVMLLFSFVALYVVAFLGNRQFVNKSSQIRVTKKELIILIMYFVLFLGGLIIAVTLSYKGIKTQYDLYFNRLPSVEGTIKDIEFSRKSSTNDRILIRTDNNENLEFFGSTFDELKNGDRVEITYVADDNLGEVIKKI